jgi:hypothetical protein
MTVPAGRPATTSDTESSVSESVVNGVKQRALFGWYSHLCTASGPSAKAMGTHGPLDPAAPEGKTGAARDGPREACLMSADPRDTGQYSLRAWGEARPSQLGEQLCTHA